MHWRTKAQLQNVISKLPNSISYAAYYWMQRLFGNLRHVNPMTHLGVATSTWKRVQQQSIDPRQRIFFEVGTGRVPVVPLGYWLMGAGETITVDLNPYFKSNLVIENLQFISDHEAKVADLFGELLDRSRFEELLAYHRRGSFSKSSFLDLCSINYVAPGDASATSLKENSVDFHSSYSVFEHIPPNILEKILEEGNRIVKDDGLFLHAIDYTDHFAHSDGSISAINFLQYSDDEWDKIAGNRYMYMSRLRHDDYLELFESAGHTMLACKESIDEQSRSLLQAGKLPLDSRFRAKSIDVLSISHGWLVTRHTRVG